MMVESAITAVRLAEFIILKVSHQLQSPWGLNGYGSRKVEPYKKSRLEYQNRHKSTLLNMAFYFLFQEQSDSAPLNLVKLIYNLMVCLQNVRESQKTKGY